MHLPELIGGQDRTTMLSQFMGVNKNLRIQDAEFSDMTNITNDFFPAIGNRRKRGIVAKIEKPNGMLGGKYIAWVDGNKLYYDETFVCDLDNLNVERKLVIIGAYLCVFPDGIIYNVFDNQITRMDNEVTTTSNPTFTLAKLDGTVYNASNTVTSSTEPSDKTKYWIDTSKNPVVMKMYSESLSMWVSVGTTYVKISASGIGVGFKDYDAATLSGVDSGFGYNDYDFNQSSIIYKRGDDYIIIAGLINLTHTNSKPITVSRKHPDMDFVCECNNRLWGCSSDKHEIYGCKQGDPTNWNFFGGLDSDSYAATVGTHNDFTGAIAYNSTVYFFKEDGFHKLFGSKPSNYEMMWKPCRGIQKGSEKSLAYIDEYLMWKARDAVVLFDGSVETVSKQLGIEPLYEGVAGAYRNKYFISLRDEDYIRRLYVYDISKGTWCIEDDIKAIYMANVNNGFYMVDNEGILSVVNTEVIYTKIFPDIELFPDNDSYAGNVMHGTLEDTIEWSLTTGDIGMDSPNMKYIKRIDVRLLIDKDAMIKFEAEYESSGAWEDILEYVCTSKRSYTIPIAVHRCDHMKLRMSGRGDVRIFSIAIVREEGSDGNV